ncbi:MAG TPA: flagellin [Terriglobales bacterium]|nr:flagellin [Terriglobales bacterium]
MALSVLNNIASLAAQNQLAITNSNLQKSLFQLSSGSRINSGADDAAGLAIADGLHANITALTQSARNANDGVGKLQVADGSLAQVTTLLNRAVTLATESATGTVSDSQRTALDAEFTAIKAEIDRIGSKTNYNGGQVFTANTTNVFLSDASAASNSTIGVTTGLLSANGLGLGGAVAATATLSQTPGAAAVAATDTFTGAAFTQGAAATGALTYVNNAVNNDTATIAGTTYKFVTTLSGAANEVLIGSTAAQSVYNLAAAINATPGGAGIAYGAGTVANTNVYASAANNVLTVTANVNGTAGNAFTTAATTTGVTGAGNLTGGAAGATVTVGGKTYTFVAALSHTLTANEVVATSEAVGLSNLAAAVNGTGGSGYSSNTAANTQVTAGTSTGTTLKFTAINPGTGGNFISTGASGTVTGTWASLYFTGGTDAGTAPSLVAGDTVTVGTQTYSFVSALGTPAAGGVQVLVGPTNTSSLANLANAINGGSGAGISYIYGTGAGINTLATAVAGQSSVALTAINKGTSGNSIALATTGSGADTFGGATFMSGGAAGSINDLLTQSDATAALATINSAVQTVASLRGTIGATVNRLQSAAGVIDNQVQNLTGAEDGVRAADIPSTIASLAKYSILEQTGISALAQANQQQQLVLKLLQ